MSTRFLTLVAATLVGACSTTTGYDLPSNASIIPPGSLKLSPTVAFSYEKLAMGAAGAALIYFVYDPLAPNWEIQEAFLGDDSYLLAMKMKRFHTGGDGEAMMLFKRRAAALRAAKGYRDYEILEFVEGIESSTPVAQRYSQGVIRLLKAPG
jgi:hypothetical protein